MFQKYKKAMIAVFVTIVIFPVTITFVTGMVNKNSTNQVIKSGKIVIIENERYQAQMDVEDFIPCVLMAQMPIDSPIEALKAQAVVIRTYIYHEMGEKKIISAQKLGLKYVTYENLKEIWFHKYKINQMNNAVGVLCNLTDMGSGNVYRNNLSYLHKIIAKTSGKVLIKDGQVILPLFHSISNGTTRDGNTLLGSEYSYLKSVQAESDKQEKNYLSVNFYTLKEFQQKLKDQGIIIYQNKKELDQTQIDLQQFVKMIDLSQKDENGYVLEITIADTKISADEFIKALELKSTALDISLSEDKIRVTTKGDGHGFGLSISYANKLAEQGNNWRDILNVFYNAAIE